MLAACRLAARQEVPIMSGRPVPMVRRRQLGAALRQHRIDAGLSIREVAGKLLCSQSKISRIESAQRNISLRDVRDLMDLYKIRDPALRKSLMRLAEESRQAAWWTDFNLSTTYERLIGLEGSAATILEYQIGVIPGLLQTSDYALGTAHAWSDDPNVIKNLVDVRVARQRFLAKETVRKFIFDESVLHRTRENPELMRDQIQKIIDAAAEPHVDVQIIPFAAGVHRGLISGFVVLQFPKSESANSAVEMSDVVYLEGNLDRAVFLEDPDEVAGYIETFTGLQEKALGTAETVAFLKDFIRGL
jgi:transcriptional regulator with XRE-family HTH domain